jgi:hypothetical protein
MNYNGLSIYPNQTNVNPFLWNIKGDWRAEKSYAYLTGRNASAGQVNNPRNEGFYNKFNPFYKLDENKKWYYDIKTDWTYASSVSKYSPYGVELENKDALNRHSAAQYGYNYTLPMAVASNSKYEQIGFEGFEESDISDKHFGFDIDRNAISGNQSHTGRKSIKVLNGEKVKLTNSLKEPVIETTTSICPAIPSGNCLDGFNVSNRNNPCLATSGDYGFSYRDITVSYESNINTVSLVVNNDSKPLFPLTVGNPIVNNNSVTFCVTADLENSIENNLESSFGNFIDVFVTLENNQSCCVRLAVGGINNTQLGFYSTPCN